jgi:hypothetical protein
LEASAPTDLADSLNGFFGAAVVAAATVFEKHTRPGEFEPACRHAAEGMGGSSEPIGSPAREGGSSHDPETRIVEDGERRPVGSDH